MSANNVSMFQLNPASTLAGCYETLHIDIYTLSISTTQKEHLDFRPLC